MAVRREATITQAGKVGWGGVPGGERHYVGNAGRRVVLYPNGHKRAYWFRGWGMPRAGRRYVLFLIRQGEAGDYRILTGYEISEGQVIPLDDSWQFGQYRCRAEDAFLSAIRASINGEGRNEFKE